MAKAKSKDKKSGVPKKLAGVKVPKAVRESKSLSTLLTSNLGREILADALIAAAGAAAAALTRTRTAKDAGQSSYGLRLPPRGRRCCWRQATS